MKSTEGESMSIQWQDLIEERKDVMLGNPSGSFIVITRQRVRVRPIAS